MDGDVTNKVWYKPWWKAVLLIVIFPVSLSYLIWKQKWPVPAKVITIAILWIVFVGLGNSGNNSGTEANTEASLTLNTTPSNPEPTAVTYSLEQKQQEFRDFYPKYEKYLKDLLQFQTFISGKTTVTNKGELYSALEGLKQNQEYYGSDKYKPQLPESLKDNENLTQAMSELTFANYNFTKSIDEMMKYVNKDEAKSYAEAKNQIERGETRIVNSMDKVRATASELEITLEGLSVAE